MHDGNIKKLLPLVRQHETMWVREMADQTEAMRLQQAELQEILASCWQTLMRSSATNRDACLRWIAVALNRWAVNLFYSGLALGSLSHSHMHAYIHTHTRTTLARS